MNLTFVSLKKSRELSIKRKHPWVFSGAIASKTDLNDGTLVEIKDYRDNFLGIGYWTNGSICVRILSFEEKTINHLFWVNKIKNAFDLRKSMHIINKQTNAYRLINGEGDNISGLIVDVYNDYVVIQFHNLGIYQFEKEIRKAIQEALSISNDHIISKGTGNWVSTDFKSTNPETASTTILENGIQFHIDLIGGQKTGFFLDQRENRHLLAQYSEGKSVCNLFCYTGGFSLYALQAGATTVTSIDISKPAMEIVEKNISLNKYKGTHQGIKEDIMNILHKEDFPCYDILVVDPPAFAKNIRKKHNAVQAYKRLNIKAIKKVNPNGLVFTFSCSQVVDTPLFIDTIRSAAIESGRKIRVLKQLSQGMDHPTNIFHKEGRYLKGLLLQVE